MIDAADIEAFEEWKRVTLFNLVEHGSLVDQVGLFNRAMRNEQAQKNVQEALAWIAQRREALAGEDAPDPAEESTLDMIEGIISSTEPEYIEERTLSGANTRHYIGGE